MILDGICNDVSHTILMHQNEGLILQKRRVNLSVSRLYSAFTDVCSTTASIHLQKDVNKVLL